MKNFSSYEQHKQDIVSGVVHTTGRVRCSKLYKDFIRCHEIRNVQDYGFGELIQKLAPIRDVREKCLEVLSKLHYPDGNVTVDKQLVAFCGCCDIKSSYMLKAQINRASVPSLC